MSNDPRRGQNLSEPPENDIIVAGDGGEILEAERSISELHAEVGVRLEEIGDALEKDGRDAGAAEVERLRKELRYVLEETDV